jgi:hypothetical protein
MMLVNFVLDRDTLGDILDRDALGDKHRRTSCLDACDYELKYAFFR